MRGGRILGLVVALAACGSQESRPADPASEAMDTTRQEVATPDQRTIDEVSVFLGIPPSSLIKSLVYVAGDEPVMVLVRGDHSLHEGKLARHLKREVRPAHPDEVKEVAGAEVGFVGPVGVSVRIVADESLRPAISRLSSPISARPPRGILAGNAAAH